MQWSDEGIVIGVRRHGETGVILDLLTRDHGRHMGFVQGGRSRRLRPCLQPGNTLEVGWRARVEEQLGAYTVEPAVLRGAAVMASAGTLAAVHHLGALARLLAEREPHPSLYRQLEAILSGLDDPVRTPAAIVRFELSLLADLGFGLDLSRCAATGGREALVYVSPRTGRAVSAAAGAPYRDRLLPLPAFLADAAAEPDTDELVAGFRLTEHFLRRDLFAPRDETVPVARATYLDAVLKRGG